MRLNKNITNKLNFIVDELFPPILRDSKFFMSIVFKIFFGKKSDMFINFKEKAFSLSDKEFLEMDYSFLKSSFQRETDLTNGCLAEILKNIRGTSALDVGCGRGYLSSWISEKGCKVTAVDINITKQLRKKFPSIIFREANAESLPFQDRTFDTVVCTHTLEHTRYLLSAINELRRVCKKRLIIVVPKQRPYKYTFDSHLHFFPYTRSFLEWMGNRKSVCKVIEGDIFYMEDVA